MAPLEPWETHLPFSVRQLLRNSFGFLDLQVRDLGNDCSTFHNKHAYRHDVCIASPFPCLARITTHIVLSLVLGKHSYFSRENWPWWIPQTLDFSRTLLFFLAFFGSSEWKPIFPWGFLCLLEQNIPSKPLFLIFSTKSVYFLARFGKLQQTLEIFTNVILNLRWRVAEKEANSRKKSERGGNFFAK